MEDKQRENSVNANDFDFEEYAIEFLNQFISENCAEGEIPRNSINGDNDDIVDQLCVQFYAQNETLPDLHIEIQDSLNEILRTSSPEVRQEIYDPGPSTSRAVFNQPQQFGGNAPVAAEPLNFIRHTQDIDDFFKVKSYTDEFRINPPPRGVASAVWIERAFRELYNRMIAKITPDTCRIIFKFQAEGMSSPAFCNITSENRFPYDQFWKHVETVCQSARVYDALGDKFTLQYSVLSIRGACIKEGFEKHRRNSTYRIDNSDNLCLPRSLVVSLYAAKEFTEKRRRKTEAEEKMWKEICDARRDAQANSAIELSIAAGVDVPDNGCGLEEIVKYQQYLAVEERAAIIVYSCSKDSDDTHRFYDGTKRVKELGFEVQHALYIAYYVDFNHYEPIRCIHKFINKKYEDWCEVCQKGFAKIRVHRCPENCPNCFKNSKCEPTILKRCYECRRSFSNEECFNHHKSATSYCGMQSVCSAVQICDACSSLIIVGVAHHCGKRFCSICGEYRYNGHGCFMKKIKLYVKKQNTVRRRKCECFVSYDFETRQDEEKTINGTTVNVHVPNYYVAQITCEVCAEFPDDDICEVGKRTSLISPCYVCPIREYKYHGDDAIDNFLDVIFNLKRYYKKVICIAHNAKSYDAQFIFRTFIKKRADVVESLITGSNIMLMQYENIKFIDSLNYIQMPLAAFPKTFGLKDITKGYFPHFFNTKENQDYVGPMPPKETFGIRAKNQKERDEFEKWYDKHVSEGYVFNFKKEIERYCILDVVILRRSVMLFRKLIQDIGKICPFSRCLTIASTCMEIFAVNFLKQDQIAIIPKNGYRLTENQSRKAIEWLLWLEKSENIQIQHAGRGREKVMNGIRVDGYRVDQDGREWVYQFQGCYWHGCPRCFPSNRTLVSKDNSTFQERFINTQTRNLNLLFQNIILIEMWECDYNKEKLTNIEMKKYVESIDVQVFLPLDPRDAFFGGRTGNTVTYYEAQPGEQIRYEDVCSLYPYVLKTGGFPVGHPEIMLWDRVREVCPNNDISKIEGLIKCRVLAPQHLYHAVLPVRFDGKLYFPLCRTCLEEKVDIDCPHELESEREFLGTWTSVELKLAVEKGYKIRFISEIWHYQIVKYNPQTGEEGIFTSYINAFLKIKQEASDWPSWCTDEQSKNRYLDEYERVEGIRLDREKIEKNPGLRAVAKLCLNCLWGKFAQRDNLIKNTIVRSPEEFLEIAGNAENDIADIIKFDATTMLVKWRNVNEAADISPKTNVVIAAFTTAHARKKLYSYLYEKDDKVLYFDTDSIIYKSNGYDGLPLGNFLGDLTDELEAYGPGSYIKSFVSGGPKFYSYIVQKPDGSTAECLKMKGVRIDEENSQLINYKSILGLLDGTVEPFTINYSAIRRTKTHEVVTRDESKIIRVTGPKRRFDTETTTVPYGYVKRRRTS